MARWNEGFAPFRCGINAETLFLNRFKAALEMVPDTERFLARVWRSFLPSDIKIPMATLVGVLGLPTSAIRTFCFRINSLVAQMVLITSSDRFRLAAYTAASPAFTFPDLRTATETDLLVSRIKIRALFIAFVCEFNPFPTGISRIAFRAIDSRPLQVHSLHPPQVTRQNQTCLLSIKSKLKAFHRHAIDSPTGTLLNTRTECLLMLETVWIVQPP